jgi:ribonucleoside-diphosphate reductase alpha chain
MPADRPKNDGTMAETPHKASTRKRAAPRRDPGPSAANGRRSGGLKIERRFTIAGIDPLDQVEYELRACRISNPDGTIVFEMTDVEIPKAWSQLATDIVVSKYFRKAGVPQLDRDGKPVLGADGKPRLGPERSVRQVVSRLAKCWRFWGESYGYFNSPEDAQAYEDEMAHTLVHQMGAPNSPQWFNTGLAHAYGITGPSQGHYYVDPDSGEMTRATDAYTHPQPHACFIQSVSDDLVNDGGIMDLWAREARLFKYGSGTGTNFSHLRAEGESLSGGGKSSGLMSFLKIGDRAAAAIKSGGTTRRAAKMVCLDMDHPDVESFINWKVGEEKKVAALIKAGYSSDFNGEAYNTVSGQNSNNSVRIPDTFIEAIKNDGDWHMYGRVELRKAREEGRPARPMKTRKAADLWQQVAHAAWACADPGVQFDTTINAWHTCPEGGRINASNPCSEYMFLDDTACNLASLNLTTFFDRDSATFDVPAMRHSIRLWTVTLEISVLMAQFPSKEIAQRSYEYRTLGLGFANLGSCLMLAGVPYDSPEATAICGAVTAIMTGESYATSAEMAEVLGPFPKYRENAQHMMRVMYNHHSAAHNLPKEEYKELNIAPVGIDPAHCPEYLLTAARGAWDRAVELGRKHGYRNAQTTVIAPTGTIGLLMDCDTTGVEPDFALVKFKKLAGGGYFKIVNQSVEPALKYLGYNATERRAIIEYIVGTSRLDGAPHINTEALMAKGLTTEDLAKVLKSLPTVLELGWAFSPFTLGPACMARLGIAEATWSRADFDMLRHLGFTRQQVEEASAVICGSHTIEGAPALKDEHLAVFDCANRCGKKGRRFIHHMGHVNMMAAAQPFISGAISKTINMPNEVTEDDIKDAYMQSWKLGLKAVALYRDGSKLSQVLSSTGSGSEKDDEKESEGAPSPAEPIHGAFPEPLPRQANLFEQIQSLPLKLRRRPLPPRRKGFTFEAKIGGQKVYLRTGEYENGDLGEVFIDMNKEGATMRSIMNCFAIAVSKGLQYGVPLEEFVDTFTFTRFEPHGTVGGHENIKFATSVVDLVFRLLGFEYLGRTDFLQVKPEELLDRTPETLNRDTAHIPALPPAVTPVQQAPAATPAPTQEAPSASATASRKASGEQSPITIEKTKVKHRSAQDAALEGMMGDAPFCDVCGSTTVRNGACYRCLNCGNSMGCS